MEILLVALIFIICLIALNKKIDNVRIENQLNNASNSDLLNNVNTRLSQIEQIADDCVKISEKVQKQSKQITAELKILNFMNSKTVDLKGEVSNDFMNMLKKSKLKPKLRIITTKKEKKNDSNNRKRT
jgi:CRISPR/Cas system CSM-associated protein Csm2 small subunit